MNKRYTQLGDFPEEYNDFDQYHALLDRIVDTLDNTSSECYYVCNHGWDVSTDTANEFKPISDLKTINYTKDIVVWLTHDSLRGVNEHDWYDPNAKLQGLSTLQDVCKMHPARQFILLTPHCHLQSLVEVDNLHIVDLPPYPWAANQKTNWYQRGYENRSTIAHNWVTFMHSPDWHRTALLAYLLFLQLDKTGTMSVSSRLLNRACEFNSAAEYLSYAMTPIQWHCIEQGFAQLKEKTFNNGLHLPTSIGKNVITNYNDILLPVYKQTGVEIVTSSIYSEPVPYITEKEVQAIYGCNFLIFISPANTVAWLRDQGFDMFDDIVDHSYDSILDPAQRLFCAINNNINLLNGTTDLDSLLLGNTQRFRNNCELADSLSSKLKNNVIEQFTSIVRKINE